MDSTAEINILFLLKSEKKNIIKSKNKKVKLKNSTINLSCFLAIFFADLLASDCSDSIILLDFATSSCLFLVEAIGRAFFVWNLYHRLLYCLFINSLSQYLLNWRFMSHFRCRYKM